MQEKLTTDQIGKWAEQEAAQYLQQKGYTILANRKKGFRYEIDLIAMKDGILVFAEVKWRKDHGAVFSEAPLYAVGGLKQARIRSAAWMLLDYYRGEEFRFDVLLGSPKGWLHIEGAFE